jgi:hypothetical protein
MDRKRLALINAILLTSMVAWNLGDQTVSQAFADNHEAHVPDVMNGFIGLVEGTIVTKGTEIFVLRITKIEKTWKNNKAEHAEKGVGKNVPFLVNKHQREHYAGLKVGDSIIVGGIHKNGPNLQAIEVLVKASEYPALQKKWADAKTKRDAERRERETQKKAQNNRARRGVVNATFVSFNEDRATITIEDKTSTYPVGKKIRERFAALDKGKRIRINWVTEGKSERWIIGLELFRDQD